MLPIVEMLKIFDTNKKIIVLIDTHILGFYIIGLHWKGSLLDIRKKIIGKYIIQSRII